MNIPNFASRQFGWILFPLIIVGLVLSYVVPHHDLAAVHSFNNIIFGVVIAWAYARLVG